MTFGSLFSGIGGIDLGLERAGLKVKWQVENDSFCVKVLQKHWPNTKRYCDVRTVNKLEYVDLIVGGFPCQPVSTCQRDVSTMGKRKGENDDRWLWPEFCRVICLVRPKVVLVENVVGLLSKEMSVVLGDLAACGYDARWEVLQGCTFGFTHPRARVFIVAYTSRFGLQQNDNDKVLCKQTEDTWDTRYFFSGTCPSILFKEPKRKSLAGKSNLLGASYGVSNELDRDKVTQVRIKALGNAVIPQVSEFLGRRILSCFRGG